jgi:hypothetical protein
MSYGLSPQQQIAAEYTHTANLPHIPEVFRDFQPWVLLLFLKHDWSVLTLKKYVNKQIDDASLPQRKIIPCFCAF